MNKTIIININGIVFHIEEDAYEILKNYMTDVKRHFMNSADSLEITTDIENRIAEMFNELLARENKQVIVEQDVRSVIEQMGTVEDFEKSEQDTEPSFSDTYYNKGTGRRLFRDADNHLIAGVCAGIANYFDVDVVWIRLAFTLSMFFAGTGLLLYIILWIVIPKAVTRADRMAMKGEKLNLQGFKKNFEQEMGSMRQNISNFGEEAQPFVYKARDFAGDFVHHFGRFLEGFGKMLIKLVGILILMTAFGFLVFFIVAFIALLGFGSFEPFHGLPVNVLRHNHATLIYVAAFIAVIIPLISIVLLVLKGIFNVGTISRSTGSMALIIWICSVGVFVYYVMRIASEFRDGASFTQTISLKAAPNNTYHLKLNDSRYFTAEDSARLHINTMFHDVQVNDDEDDRWWRNNVHLNIEKSDVNQPVLEERYSARGTDYDDALMNARNTRYNYTQTDSLINFDYRLRGTNDDIWHGETLDLTLKLPLNAKVIVDRDMDRIADISVYDCNVTNKLDPNKVDNATFIMTGNGLQCKVDTLVTDTILRKHLPADSSKNK